MASQSYYNARVVFGELVDQYNSPVVGNSSSFGSATVSDASSSSIGQHLVVIDGTTVSLNAVPNTSEGFKFEGWSLSNPKSRLIPSNQYRVTINGSDVTAYPVFAPIDSITYNRKIYLNLDGVDQIHEGSTSRDWFVKVSNMLGYYTYEFLSDGNHPFNNVSGGITVNKIADGKDIVLYAKYVDGYDITITVNGNELPDADVENSYSNLTQETENPVTRGDGTSANSSGDNSRAQSAYRTVTIANSASSTSDMNIVVHYSPSAVTYNVTTTQSPSDGGTARVYTGSSAQEHNASGTTVTVDAGETVTLEAIASPGYSFQKWSYFNGASEQSVNSPVYSYQVNEDRDWTANFVSENPSITVEVGPDNNAGRAYISAPGVSGELTTVYRDQTSSDTVTITAASATNYEFLYWELRRPDDQRPTILYGSAESVSFGNGADTYVAVFERRVSTTTTVKAFTSIIDGGGQTHTMSGNENVSFKATYLNENGQQASQDILSELCSINVLVQSGQSGDYAEMQLHADSNPVIAEEDSHRYRYLFNSYKYTPTYVFTNDTPQEWQTLSLNADFTWIKPISDLSKDKNTVSAFYDKIELFSVGLIRMDSAGVYTGSEITVTGGGTDYTSGSTVSVSTSTTNPDRYEFVGWYDSSDTDFQTILSSDPSYTFTISENKTLIARWKTSCSVVFSANPSNLGTVICTDSDSTTIQSEDRVDYGTLLTFTCTPASGAAINNWTNGNTVIGQSETSVTIIATGDMNVKANLMETSKNLTVTTNGGGNVMIYLKEPEPGSLWINVASGIEREYHVTVPSGYGYKVTAEALQRYVYSGMRIYGANGSLIEEWSGSEYSRDTLSEDRTITVDFSLIQWITTLGNIIKVY